MFHTSLQDKVGADCTLMINFLMITNAGDMYHVNKGDESFIRKDFTVSTSPWKFRREIPRDIGERNRFFVRFIAIMLSHLQKF